jgi:hypothetical protein
VARNDGIALAIDPDLVLDVFSSRGGKIECPSIAQVGRVHVLIREQERGSRESGLTLSYIGTLLSGLESNDFNDLRIRQAFYLQFCFP